MLAHLQQPIDDQLEDCQDDHKFDHFNAPDAPQLPEKPGWGEEQVDRVQTEKAADVDPDAGENHEDRDPEVTKAGLLRAGQPG